MAREKRNETWHAIKTTKATKPPKKINKSKACIQHTATDRQTHTHTQLWLFHLSQQRPPQWWHPHQTGMLLTPQVEAEAVTEDYTYACTDWVVCNQTTACACVWGGNGGKSCNLCVFPGGMQTEGVTAKLRQLVNPAASRGEVAKWCSYNRSKQAVMLLQQFESDLQGQAGFHPYAA